MRILIHHDDELFLRRLESEVLAQFPYFEVRYFTSIESLRQELRQDRPDLLFTSCGKIWSDLFVSLNTVKVLYVDATLVTVFLRLIAKNTV